jgi:hypothetical protein
MEAARGRGPTAPRLDTKEDGRLTVPKVKVQVLSDTLSYSWPNPDGLTHTREEYKRGDVFFMEEEEALRAAEGAPVEETSIKKNASGTPTFYGPERVAGQPRASVKILPDDEAVDISEPEEVQHVIPAPAPKVEP